MYFNYYLCHIIVSDVSYFFIRRQSRPDILSAGEVVLVHSKETFKKQRYPFLTKPTNRGSFHHPAFAVTFKFALILFFVIPIPASPSSYFLGHF